MSTNLISKVILTTEQISGNSEGRAILLSVSNGYKFENGKATDILEYIKCTVVLPERNFEKITVKLKDLKCPISNEQIAQAGGSLNIRLTGLTGKIYKDMVGKLAISASCEAVEMIK